MLETDMMICCKAKFGIRYHFRTKFKYQPWVFQYDWGHIVVKDLNKIMPTSSNAFNGNLLPFQVNMEILGGLTLNLNACFHVHVVSEFSIYAFMIQPFVCHFPSTQFYPSPRILLEMFPYKIVLTVSVFAWLLLV